ncbi:natural resistance-associated macrophage protein [Solidesulfovibrio fructosivorans JJ]]|uniref:Natural resistance-associated macrophage protein n=1 Tax=Solidesulfovibrio fructosivorans JJ] TaxID=596151 RepID=E1JYF1_SOLFR|nr:Nramp family divalent metal transporter [Solidesulfovibrio fructosivorans]EFL50535.1 natural resistance-associated macrophage protein [Solidesulfovibrio fructosivorans JJ]]
MHPLQRLTRAIGDMAHFRDRVRPRLTALEIFKYVGPGLLVTVGFIDPGNWASNVAAGSDFGYHLLWMVTLSTIMLIVLQHNAAHLGIATGLCLSEAAVKHMPRPVAFSALGTAVAAAVSTALAELLGGAIALRMLFGLPLALGTLLTLVVVLWMLFSKSYRHLERYIIGFVSLIGLSFIFELSLVHLDWGAAVTGWLAPTLPNGSLPIVMSVLGAVVMPHNLFLHSEVIQSRQWNLDKPEMIRRQLKYEYLDTLFSMLVGFCINSAMILLAAAVFFTHGTSVGELEQAQSLLKPLLGPSAGIIFAISLLLAGVASSVTAGMAGGSIFAGIFGEPYDIRDSHSRLGVVITLVGAAVAILFVGDPLKGLIWSQIALSIQLPITILLQIGLTSRRSVMGEYANRPFTNAVLILVAAVVIALNIMLLVETLG